MRYASERRCLAGSVCGNPFCCSCLLPLWPWKLRTCASPSVASSRLPQRVALNSFIGGSHKFGALVLLPVYLCVYVWRTFSLHSERDHCELTGRSHSASRSRGLKFASWLLGLAGGSLQQVAAHGQPACSRLDQPASPNAISYAIAIGRSLRAAHLRERHCGLMN